MPIYYELECQICHKKQSADQSMLSFHLNRPCPDCGGPMRIVDRSIEKTGD